MAFVAATYTLLAKLGSTWTDITSDLMLSPLIIRRGIPDLLARVARVGVMTLQLDNQANAYSPDHASATSGFDIGTRLKFQANYAGTKYNLFRGDIASIEPVPGAHGQRVTIVRAHDDMDRLATRRIVALATTEGARSDQLVSTIVASIFTPDSTSYATGQSTFAFAGDTWRDENTTGLAAVTDVVRSEWGTLHVGGDGSVVFQDRHARPKDGIVDGTLSDNMIEMRASRSRDQIVNRVSIDITPRVAGTANTVLWTLDDTPIVMPITDDRPVEIIARYRRGSLGRTGAKAITISASVSTDTTGASPATVDVDYTQVTTPGGNSAKIVLTNISGAALYIQGASAEGTPLKTVGDHTVVAEDTTSQTSYGPLELSFKLPLQNNVAVAQDLADYLLALFKSPATTVKQVSLRANMTTGLMTHALAREINDLIAITETQTGLSAHQYNIEGIEHRVTDGGLEHVTTWGVSPRNRNTLWVLGLTGASELEQTTYLGF